MFHARLISSGRTASTAPAVFQAPTWDHRDGIKPLIDQALGTTASRSTAPSHCRAGQRQHGCAEHSIRFRWKD